MSASEAGREPEAPQAFAGRIDIEEELEQGQAGVNTRGNPVASWTLSIAGSLFALMFFTVVMMILFMYFLHQATP